MRNASERHCLPEIIVVIDDVDEPYRSVDFVHIREPIRLHASYHCNALPTIRQICASLLPRYTASRSEFGHMRPHMRCTIEASVPTPTSQCPGRKIHRFQLNTHSESQSFGIAITWRQNAPNASGFSASALRAQHVIVGVACNSPTLSGKSALVSHDEGTDMDSKLSSTQQVAHP